MSNAGYYPVLVIFSQRNSPASEPGQRIFSVSPGTAGNRLDRWLAECLPAVSGARIHPTAVEGDYTASDDDPIVRNFSTEFQKVVRERKDFDVDELRFRPNGDVHDESIGVQSVGVRTHFQK